MRAQHNQGVTSLNTILLLIALSGIYFIRKEIMATSADANAKLDQIGATLDKISAETTGLVTEVRELKDAAQNGDVPDAVMAKIDSLLSKSESIDALVDDVAPNPTPTPEEPA